ncbi:multiubiquitin domain-containing protein [Streptomyces sp. NPDC055210]
MTTAQTPSAEAGRHVRVFIDGHEYDAPARRVTETDLRHLPRPAVPDDKELWLDIPDAPDRPLEENETIDLTSGMRFFTELRQITIHIDRTPYVVAKKRMTGGELRAIPTPPVAEDRDLWLDIIDKRDQKIADDEVVRLRDGMRFFTAPGRINPGSR